MAFLREYAHELFGVQHLMHFVAGCFAYLDLYHAPLAHVGPGSPAGSKMAAQMRPQGTQLAPGLTGFGPSGVMTTGAVESGDIVSGLVELVTLVGLRHIAC